MKVILDHRLFQSGDAACIRDLTTILLAAHDSPHQIIIDGGAAGQQGWERWLETHHQAVIRKCFADVLARGRAPGFLRKPPATTLRVSDEVDEEIDEHGLVASAHSYRAKELIKEPLELWLENDESDAAFLRTVVPVGEFRDWLDRAKESNWIAYRHGGGSDLKNKLDALDPWARLRSWAMCDADVWEPSERSRSVKALETICKSRSMKAPELSAPAISLQVLRRRAIENYLPMPALRHWANLPSKRREQKKQQMSFAQAVAQLDVHTAKFNLRHYYHMEKGFGAEPNRIPADYAPFRADPILLRGIGDPIKKVYQSNLAVRTRGGHGWLKDAWFAEDESLRAEIVAIVESIRSRI